MTIFVTGSSGKTASHLTALLTPTHPVLIASRKPQPNATHPTVRFDWLDESTWSLPFEHTQAEKSPITAAYIVSPDIQRARDNVIPFIKLANSKGVKRFVMLSAWEVPEGGPLLGRAHAELRALGQSGVEWTVLRPQFFMENFAEPYHLPCIRKEGKLYTACADGKKPYISARDIAAVAHRALVNERAMNTEFVLTGPEGLSYDEIAAIFTEILGKKIEHVRLTRDELKQKLMTFDYPEEMADYLADLDESVANGLGWEPTENVSLVTGQEPRALRHIVTELQDTWK